MKYSLIGIVLLVLVLGGIYVYTGDLAMPTHTSAPVVPQNDNGQYNIKLD